MSRRSSKVTIRPAELEVLKAIREHQGKCEIRALKECLNKSYVEVMRVSQWLADKKLLEIEVSNLRIVKLLEVGKIYAEKGLPERRAVEKIYRSNKPLELASLPRILGLSDSESKIVLGWLRSKNWVRFDKKNGKTLVIADNIPLEGPDERFLRFLHDHGDVDAGQLSDEFKQGLQLLKRRKELVEIVPLTYRYLKLTDSGLELLSSGVEAVKEVSQLTPEIIKSGQWREAEFRKFDLISPVTKIYPGKIHPINALIEEIREIFLEFGFEEIESPLVENTFWNFDALFVPQDHPARDSWDTFYLKKPAKGCLPPGKIVNNIKQTHENGWKTGSKGWGYRWDKSEGEKLILRTHTTAATIRYAAMNPEPPKKVFCIDRVYRNEKTDYRHLTEFMQIEGIMIDKNASLRDLFGFLGEFYKKIGFPKIRFRPGYFPFTEPSVEADLYSENLDRWLEMVGAGIFRPEVTIPLGIRAPVLAWGMGFERLAMLRLNINDARILYRNDISWLRNTPSIIRRGI